MYPLLPFSAHTSLLALSCSHLQWDTEGRFKSAFVMLGAAARMAAAGVQQVRPLRAPFPRPFCTGSCPFLVGEWMPATMRSHLCPCSRGVCVPGAHLFWPIFFCFLSAAPENPLPRPFHTISTWSILPFLHNEMPEWQQVFRIGGQLSCCLTCSAAPDSSDVFRSPPLPPPPASLSHNRLRRSRWMPRT